MNDLRKTLLLIALIGTLQIIGITAYQNVTCPAPQGEIEENILLSHEYDCTKFYQCSFGRKVEHLCPQGLHFSPTKNRCEFPEIANCKSNTCPIVENDPIEDILLPHETDCTKFYKCSFGKKIEIDCPVGLHYNPNKRYCDWPANVKCRLGNGNNSTTEKLCRLDEESRLFPHESDCNKFYQCNFEKKVEKVCPSNLYFNKAISACDWPENVKCNLSLNECLQVSQNPIEDILLSHESDCTKFYKCSFGKKVLMDCPNKLHYNSKMRQCDWPKNAECKLGGNNSSSTSQKFCSINEQNNLYPHEFDCRKFYQCIFGTKYEFTCAETFHYDKERKICSWPHEVNCKINNLNYNSNTCPMVEKDPEIDILLPHENDCTKFYKCNLGKKVLIPCPSGLHFNIEKQYCDWPRFANCDPNWGNGNNTNSTNGCPNVEENPSIDVLLPHESECSLFYKCNFGERVLMECPSKLYFNVNTQSCDWKANVNCTNNISNSSMPYLKKH